jgi:hypothetical protein
VPGHKRPAEIQDEPKQKRVVLQGDDGYREQKVKGVDEDEHCEDGRLRMDTWFRLAPWDAVADLQTGKDLRVLGLWNLTFPLQPHQPLLAAQRAPLRNANFY